MVSTCGVKITGDDFLKSIAVDFHEVLDMLGTDIKSEAI